MRISTDSRPSPTVIAGAVILALAIAGTSIAGSNGLTAKLTKSSVKKIAKRQIAKAAPGLTVAGSSAADSLYARALVRTDPLQVSLSRNIAQAQVDQARMGVTCFDLDFTPVGVQVTKETTGLDDTRRSFRPCSIRFRASPRGRKPIAAAVRSTPVSREPTSR